MGGTRWKLRPDTIRNLIEWAKDDVITLSERAKRYYTVHQRLTRVTDNWTLRDSANLFEDSTSRFVHYYSMGQVLSAGTDPYTYMVITRLNGDDPFVVGEIVVVDQSGLEVCGRHRRPRRYPSLWWEEYKDMNSAIKRALIVTAGGAK
jgi:hypothetical protein